MSNIGDYGITAGAAAQSAASPHGCPEGWAPSSVNNWGREFMAGVSRWYKDQNGELSVGGTSAAFTLTSFESKAGSAIAAYSVMPLMVCRTSVKCAASPTINIDGLGARALIKNGRIALEDGDLTSQQVFVIAYNHNQSAVEVLSPTNKSILLQSDNTWTGQNIYSGTASFHTQARFEGTATFSGQARIAGATQNNVATFGADAQLQDSGLALYIKAGAHFTGGGANGAKTLNASKNVTSVTRTGTGTYDVIISPALTSANFLVFGFAQRNATNADLRMNVQNKTDKAFTTTTFTIVTLTASTGSAEDCDNCGFVVVAFD